MLVEKPITDEADQAAELVQLAQENDRVLQVGHVERQTGLDYLQSVAKEPRFIKLTGSRRIRRAAWISVWCWI